MKGGSRMDFKVGVGKSDFADLRKSDNYYVDKTKILYELVHDTDNKVTLFTRPRRFGKTLMISMIKIIMRMLDVVKGLMSMALKDNEYLKFAVITGCLKIAKESIFTGTNNFAS